MWIEKEGAKAKRSEGERGGARAGAEGVLGVGDSATFLTHTCAVAFLFFLFLFPKIQH